MTGAHGDGDDDDQYKRATQVVAEAMRTDALGPALERVLREHLPANMALRAIVARAIREDVQVREALEDFSAKRDTQRVGRRVVKVGWLVTASVVSLGVGSAVTFLVTHLR